MSNFTFGEKYGMLEEPIFEWDSEKARLIAEKHGIDIGSVKRLLPIRFGWCSTMKTTAGWKTGGKLASSTASSS